MGKRCSGGASAWSFSIFLLIAAVASSVATGADRTTAIIPRAASDPPPAAQLPGNFPDAAFDKLADGWALHEGWTAYRKVWQLHRQDPSNADVRRYLGLPVGESRPWTAKRSRSAPTWLRWRPGTYAEVDSPHFVVYSQASEQATAGVIEDLERSYWVWTQLFFPLWESSRQVAETLKTLTDETDVSEFLQQNRGRITISRKLAIVLFGDVNEYAKALSPDVPGIERSTGFYSDVRKTTCLYADAVDDPATRRHELVHQLFREATRSGLGRSMPGERSDFWLVEGIAGYFESLFIDGESGVATVGGWDSPRLQFARYRTLVGGDQLPIQELRVDGRLAAQQRGDIARWYAHAIAQTHRLMDAGNANDRLSVYRELANLYRIREDLPEVQPPSATAQSMRDFLAIDDEHIRANPVHRSLESLCLAGCEVTNIGLASIGPQPNLTWLDLARLPVGNDSVELLAPSPRKLKQLTLEATRIDSGLAGWIGRANGLQELDLCWTSTGDSVIEAIKPARDLSVLWMTGSKLTDASTEAICGMKSLKSIDVQRTEMTPEAIERVRQASAATVNPLELRTAP